MRLISDFERGRILSYTLFPSLDFSQYKEVVCKLQQKVFVIYHDYSVVVLKPVSFNTFMDESVGAQAVWITKNWFQMRSREKNGFQSRLKLLVITLQIPTIIM